MWILILLLVLIFKPELLAGVAKFGCVTFIILFIVAKLVLS